MLIVCWHFWNIYAPEMDFALLREFQMEHDQLIKQQNGNIYNLPENPESYGTDARPSPSAQSSRAARLGQQDGGKRHPPAPRRPAFP